MLLSPNGLMFYLNIHVLMNKSLRCVVAQLCSVNLENEGLLV